MMRRPTAAYRGLVEHYGHVAIEPGTHTGSWMIGRGLGIGRGERSEDPTHEARNRTLGLSQSLPCLDASYDPRERRDVDVGELRRGRRLLTGSHPAIDWMETPNAAPA